MNRPERRCPECNAIIKPGESFCLNCGATVQMEENAVQQEESAVEAEETRIEDFPNVTTDSVPVSDGDVISRSNITGSVYKTNNTSVNNTSNTTVNDSSSTTTNNTRNVNTNVINRSTSTNTSNSNNVTNTTNTIINQQAAPEFCTVCGRSLNNSNKARCPKCQKTICSACLVSGKNRCTECEKKAVDEYRLAYQELLYTTNGNIGVAGERLMKRKAEELNVVDSAREIEDDILAMFKGSTQQQPQQAENSKGVGSLSGRQPLTMSKDDKKPGKGGGSKFVLVAVLLIAAAGGYFYFTGRDKGGEAVTETKNEQMETKKEVEVKKEAEPKKEIEVKKETEPKKEAEPKKETRTEPAVTQPKAQETVQTAKPAAKKIEEVAKDSNYEEGMKAYEANNGVEAIKKFKASGSAKSKYMIGVIYENGCGTITKNAMKARQAFKEAAKLGSEEAKAKL